MAVYDVFLSYRRSDGSNLAKDLYQKLQRAGLRVFFDQSEMVDGHYFNTQISAALKQAPNYLLVATPEVFPFRDEAQESDWVKKEIELAFEQYEQDQQNRSLNILMLPGTELPAESSLPESLKNLDFPNRINISWSLQSSELQRILKAVCHVNRRNIWHAAHRWLEESKQPGHRFASLHVNESIMPQAKHHKEDCQDQTTFPIHVSKEANDMQKQEIPLLDALRETSGHLYLIGQGGIGKTTALMHIMEATYHEKQYTETAQIPIFIELSRAPDTEGRLYDGITSTYIRRSVYQQIRKDLRVKQVPHAAVRQVEEVFNEDPSVAVEPVEELFLAKQDGQEPEYLLLLDGLNEVSHTEVNELPVISRIIQEIKWLMDCPNVRVILTSRTDEEAVFHENISRLYLTGIQNEALRDYLQKSKHEEEIDAIFQNEPLLETLRIPLFLMMYAGLGQTKDVSSQGEILRIFFHEREQNLEDYTIQTRAKQVEQDVATASPKQSSVRITAQMQSFLLDFLLPEIAWAMERSDTFYLDTETIEEIIAPILTDKSDTAICGKYGKGLFTKYRTSSAKEHTAATAKKLLALGDDTLEVTESLIDIATRSLGILQERNGTYGFIHHHIRDYFAAARHVVHLRLAVYLQEKGSEQALTCLDDLKPEPIHLNIRRFIGEMLGEHHNAPQCINGTWTEMVPKEACDRTLLQRALFLYCGHFDTENNYGVFSLVSILKEVRMDLSGAIFSNLDLRNCSLNGSYLGHVGVSVDITDAKVNIPTFFHMGHTGCITAISYSPDGHYLATGSEDCSVKIWEITTGTCMKTLNIGWPITAISYDPNSRYIVVGSLDKTINVFDTQSGICIKTLCGFQGHKLQVSSVTYSPNGQYILSGSYDGTAKIWKANTGKCLQTLQIAKKNHSMVSVSDAVSSVSFSSDSRYAILGLCGGAIKIWDLLLNECIKSLDLIELLLNNATDVVFSFSSNCQYAVLYHNHLPHYYDDVDLYHALIDGAPVSMSSILSDSRSACIYDILNNKFLQILSCHKQDISSISFSPDNQYVVTGSLDRTAKVWDLKTGLCIQTLVGHNREIWSVKYIKDGNHIVTGSEDGTLKIWHAKTGTCLQTLKGYMQTEPSVDFSPDGCHAIIGSVDGTVQKWNLSTGICTQILVSQKNPILSAHYTPDGITIITLSEDNSIKLWDAETGLYKYSLNGTYERFITCSPNGDHIITAVKCDSDIAIVDAQTGDSLETLVDEIYYISYFYNEECVYKKLYQYYNFIEIHTIDMGSTRLDFPPDYHCITPAKFSPDGENIALILTNDKEESVNILNIKTRKITLLKNSKKDSMQKSTVTSIDFALDGVYIIASYKNGCIEFWNIHTKKLERTIITGFEISYVCRTANSSQIGVLLCNRLFKLLDIPSGRWISTFPNVPGLILQGVDFRHIHPDSSLDEEHRELLRRYGAIID